VGRVEGSLRKLEGVESAEVYLLLNSAKVVYDPHKLDPKQILQAIEKAGYKATLSEKQAYRDHDHHEREHEPHDHLEHVTPLVEWRAIVSSVIALPILISSTAQIRGIHQWVLSPMWQLILSTPVMFWAGWPILQAAGKAIRARFADMYVLIAGGTLVAYLYSLVAALFPKKLQEYGIEPYIYFEVTTVIVAVVLWGRLLEERARRGASRAIQKLLALQPLTANVIRNELEQNIPLREVVAGDIIRVRPGEKVPVDGIILEGRTKVDESLVTGESESVSKQEHDKVIGGTINVSGSFLMKATAVGEETVLAHIVELVKKAQASKAPIQALADRVTSVFVPAVIGVAVLTFLRWFFVGLQIGASDAFPRAMLNAIAVLIIACPCALGIATPIAVVMGTGRGAEKGILFRDAQAIELASAIQGVAFDKTGTLTEGKPKLITVVPLSKVPKEELLTIAASVEQLSEHPLARAISENIPEENMYPVTDFQSHTGRGVSAKVGERFVRLGSLKWFKEQGIALPDLGKEVGTCIVMAFDDQPVAAFYVADKLRPTSKAAVQKLRELGINIWMLTGDREEVAQQIAQEVGIPHYQASMSPEDKLVVLKKLKSEGHKIAMVGDGVNDAPALAISDLGVALSSGTDVAIETAKVTLMRPELTALVDMALLSRRTMQIIRQNLFLAFFYNTVAIPVAVVGLLNPILASVAMVVSSLSVVFNALRLRKA
jgi:Cu+-exporting ATPase